RSHTPAKEVRAIGEMREDREDEHMNKALRKLSVVKSADPGNKAKHGREAGAGRDAAARGGIDSRRAVGSSRRYGAFETRCQTILAVNDSAHIALAALAERLTAGPAIGRCGLVGMYSTSHTIGLQVSMLRLFPNSSFRQPASTVFCGRIV